VALGEEPDGVDALSHAGLLGALGVQRGGVSARNVSSVLRDVLTKMVLVAYVPSTIHIQNCFLLDELCSHIDGSGFFARGLPVVS